MYEETSWLLTMPVPELKVNLCLSLMSGVKRYFRIERLSVGIVVLCTLLPTSTLLTDLHLLGCM